jgi:hypothetical protein
MTKLTCASCKHIGKMYHYTGCQHFHQCGMSDQRRKEGSVTDPLTLRKVAHTYTS